MTTINIKSFKKEIPKIELLNNCVSYILRYATSLEFKLTDKRIILEGSLGYFRAYIYGEDGEIVSGKFEEVMTHLIKYFDVDRTATLRRKFDLDQDNKSIQIEEDDGEI